MLISPAKADHATLMALKRRLEDALTYLACMKCKTIWRSRIGGLRERISCSKCGGLMVASLRPYEKTSVEGKHGRMKKLTDKELRKLLKVASLVASHGKRAAMALAARGVGPETAARILRGLYDTEEDFLRHILAAEVNYARTKRFWD